MKRADPILLGLLGFSLVGNVVLYRRQIAPPAVVPTQITRGVLVPSLKAKGPNGEPVELRFDKRPVVLYVFSPSCIWCDRNLDNAKALAESSAKGYDFYAVAIDKRNLDSYVERHALPWPVLTDVPRESLSAFRMGVTPQTIVVDVGSTVQHVWTGAYAGRVADEIEEAFGMRLPGLRTIDVSAPAP